MADTTYENQAKVYRKQGITAPSDLIIANGGTETIESGGKITTESGGEIEVQSGGSLDFQDGANFYLAGETSAIGASVLRNAIYSQYTVTNYISNISNNSAIGNAAGITISTLDPGYGIAIFSAATGGSKMSLKLPSAHKGAVLIMNFNYLVGDANFSFLAASGGGIAGVSLNAASGTDLSSFEMSAIGQIKLVCQTENLWQIVETTDSLTIRASA